MQGINQQLISIPTGGGTTDITIPEIFGNYVPDNIDYVIDTATSLTSSAAIVVDESITPVEGMQCNFRYMGRIATFTNSATVSLLGYTLTSAQAAQWLDISFVYTLDAENNSESWVINSYSVLNPNTSYVAGMGTLPIVLEGQTKTLVVGTDKTNQALNWTGTLTGSNSITATGLNNGDTFIFHYVGSVTIGAYAISFMGVLTLTAAQAQQNLTITAIYNGSAWTAQAVEGVSSLPLTNPGVTKYTLTGATQASQTLTAGVSKQILELAGNTTLTGNYSVTFTTPVAGEASFQVVVPAILNLSTYTLTIGGVVIPQWMALMGGYSVFTWWDSTNSVWVTQLVPPPAASNQIYTVKVVVATAAVLTQYTTPNVLVAAPGSGLIIDPIDVWDGINYATAAYATHTVINVGHAGADIALFTDTYTLLSTKTLQPRKMTPVLAADSTSQQSVANAALVASTPTGNPVTGGGAEVFWVTFQYVVL
jgi:hypothetical protein